jgi:RimJ/RimL family protein N-acetyltransferase
MESPPQVLLRRFRGDDARALLEAARESREQIFPWLPWCHEGYVLADSEAWIARCATTWENGTEYNFAIVDGADRLLGGCGLNQVRPEHRVANLGYWVRTSSTGRGVATAAVRRLADFAFRETDLARLEIVVALGNAASHRVAVKAGALREGVARDRLYAHGASHDAVVYALLRSSRRQP